MKFPLKQLSILFILLFCFISTTSYIFPLNDGEASSRQTIENIAIILDSSEFYDNEFKKDVLNGFDLINQTYGINYEVFNLTKYSSPGLLADGTVVNRKPYLATYYFNETFSETNHTQLASELISTGSYDMIVFMGYQLRHGKGANYLPDDNTDVKFLYYDLSGELPDFPVGSGLGDNVAVVGFDESHNGFIAGTLAAATISPTPNKIAMIGTYRASKNVYNPKVDSRSRQLIAGFQSGFLRQVSDVKLLISYIDFYEGNWANYDTSKELGEELESEGYDLIFTALQNNNTLGIIDGFSKSIVTVDSNRTGENIQSIVKNNTKTLLSLFDIFNQSNGFRNEVFIYGLADNVYYPSGWENAELVNNTFWEIYNDVVIEETVVIPNDIYFAENTSGFKIVTLVLFIVFLSFIHKRNHKKRRG